MLMQYLYGMHTSAPLIWLPASSLSVVMDALVSCEEVLKLCAMLFSFALEILIRAMLLPEVHCFLSTLHES